MSWIHDRDVEAAVPEHVRDLDRGPVSRVGAGPGAGALPGLEAAPGFGEVPGSWSALTDGGRRGGHPSVRGALSRLQSAAGNAAVAGLLEQRASEARRAQRVGPTLRHAGDVDAPDRASGSSSPRDVAEPAEGATPLDDEDAVPAPTSSFTKVGPPSPSSYTVSGTLRQAAEAVAARPEAGATITQPFLNMAPDGRWPTHVQVTVTQVVVLPEWDGKASATQNQRNEWDRFKAAITAHENGHVATDVKAFANAHVKIKAKKSRPEGETEFDTIATQSDTDNGSFDAKTDHGRPATNINPNIDEVTKVP